MTIRNSIAIAVQFWALRFAVSLRRIIISPRAHCSERLADGKVANGGGRPLQLHAKRPRRTPLGKRRGEARRRQASLRLQAHAREMVDPGAAR